MSILPIQNTSFSLIPLNKESYDLKIDFWDAAGSLISQQVCTFTQSRAPIEDGQLFDIYSQNGVYSRGLFTNKDEALFRQSDLKGIGLAAQKLTLIQPPKSTIIVLDLMDPSKSYLDIGSIREGEEMICDFLKSKEPEKTVLSTADKVHKIFKEMPLDYVFCESSLKHTILCGFSDLEIEYLLKKPIEFCQLTEFFINAFKFGQSTRKIVAQNFFTPIASASEFKPITTSMVWYPAAYKNIYGIDGAFFNTMRPVFSVSGDFDGSITSACVRPL